MVTEYGIAWAWNNEILRKGMTKDQAADWLSEYLLDGGRPGAFEVVEIKYEYQVCELSVDELADSMERMSNK